MRTPVPLIARAPFPRLPDRLVYMRAMIRVDGHLVFAISGGAREPIEPPEPSLGRDDKARQRKTPVSKLVALDGGYDTAHDDTPEIKRATPATDRRRLNAQSVATSPTPVAEPSEQYLSVQELATRIPYAEQTIRNFMSRGVLRLNVHYVKLNGRGRPIFRWSAIQRWLEGQ